MHRTVSGSWSSFTALKPLKKKWVSHPILDDEEIIKMAADAGCWYVYQAIFDTSDVIRNRIQRLKDHGISVEGTILLGTDNQDEDYIKRLVDFLIEIELDMAEFTILTPFPHSPIREEFEKEGRILSNNWLHYTADKVVFQPKHMTPEKLQELFYYAWDTFYGEGGYQLKMGELFRKVIRREIEDGTYRRYDERKKTIIRTKDCRVMSRIFLISSNTTIDPYPVYPVGMAIIASALAEAGHEVRQFDFLVAEQSDRGPAQGNC